MKTLPVSVATQTIFEPIILRKPITVSTLNVETSLSIHRVLVQELNHDQSTLKLIRFKSPNMFFIDGVV